jgi:porin
LQRGATYSGVLQFGADLDFEKMFGWQGASFNTSWVWNAGGSQTTNLTGALFPSSNIEGPDGFRALDLWLQQKLFDDVFTIRAGLFNADRDFTISEGCQLFLNSAFGWPLLYNGNLGGPPAYPFAAPGLYAAVEPGGGWKFQAAIMQGIVWPPAENPTNFYWRLTRENGLLYLGEAEYGWTDAPLPGTAKLGVMFNSGYPDYVDQEGSAWGGSFVYGIIDQMLWPEPAAAEKPSGPAAGEGASVEECAPAAEEGDAAAARFDFAGNDFAGVQLAAGDDDVRTMVGEGQRHFAAQPATATGDEGNLAREVKQIRAHGMLLRLRAL